LPGHPITTGIDTIDYYISGKDYESENSDELFSEKLIKFDTLPAFYEKPVCIPAHQSLAQFNLPVDKKIYFCTGLLHKVSPHMDKAFERILSKDPKSIIVFANGQQDQLQFLLNRFKKTIPKYIDRIMVIPFMSSNTFYNFLKLVDVPLDTFFFAGGNTSFQALGLGCPMVTLPDRSSSGRATYALYAKMGIFDCVADSIENYADIAIKLANDRNFYNYVSNKILSKNHILFEDMNACKYFEDFLIQVAQQKPIYRDKK
jgi:predicted O-linked N-acetylglucosamine transferase (SPINDLY family)